MPKKLNLNEKAIIKMYLEDKISTKQIAKKFKCSDVHICKILKKNNVPRYPNGFFNRGKPSWCKGLTKETDERVKKISEKLIGHECYKDPIRNKKLSDAKMGQPSWCKGMSGEEYFSHFK